MTIVKRIRLCSLDDLDDPGTLRGSLPGDTENRGVCVVQRDGRIFVYENRCPHTGAPMDWAPGRFLDVSGSLIQCSLHGAQFRIEDGFCVWGPCAGDRLRPLPFVIEQGSIWLEMPTAD